MYNLSVVIPYFNEDRKVIKRALDSISIQSGISHSNQFEVILVNDCGRSLEDDPMFKDYDFEIVHIKLKKNGGPGVARQAGIDVARGQYVTFVDADDLYMNAITFNLIYQIISQPLQQNQVRPNLIYCKWIEEHKVKDRYMITERNPDDTWVFQKIYRVGFLRENNIRFDPYLRWHEDSYFNAVFKSFDNIQPAQISIPTYLWKASHGTITRYNKGEYSVSSIHVFIDAIELATKKINNPMSFPAQYSDIILYNMYSIMHPHWHDDRGKPWFEYVLKRLAKVYKDHKDEIAKLDEQTFNRIVTSARGRTLNEMERELWTVDEFINVLDSYDEDSRAKAFNHDELFSRKEFADAKSRTDKEGYNTPDIVAHYTMNSYGDVMYRRDDLFDYKILNEIPNEPITEELFPEFPGALRYRKPGDDLTKEKVLLGSKILGNQANPLFVTTIVEELPALSDDSTNLNASNIVSINDDKLEFEIESKGFDSSNVQSNKVKESDDEIIIEAKDKFSEGDKETKEQTSPKDIVALPESDNILTNTYGHTASYASNSYEFTSLSNEFPLDLTSMFLSKFSNSNIYSKDDIIDKCHMYISHIELDDGSIIDLSTNPIDIRLTNNPIHEKHNVHVDKSEFSLTVSTDDCKLTIVGDPIMTKYTYNVVVK